MPWHEITLDENGGDRATAYTMSNKILQTQAGLLCTWLDADRMNCYALVDTRGHVLKRGFIGEPMVDNHCGAALAMQGDTIHALLGGHHTPLAHYILEPSQDKWTFVSEIEDKATYPALITDSEGKLHATYRQNDQPYWHLATTQFENGQWATPQRIITAEKSGYIYWTNAITADTQGDIHLLTGLSRLKDEKIGYSAGRLKREVNGQWLNVKGEAYSCPVKPKDIQDIYPLDASFWEDTEHQKQHDIPGPLNLNYYQINLSNAMIDAEGQLRVIYHNVMTGEAWLLTLGQESNALPLRELMTSQANQRIHAQSSLTLTCDGHLRIALMIEDTPEHQWGAPGTRIALLEINTHGELTHKAIFRSDNGEDACWLPALPHPQLAHATPDAMLYTYGENAGGFDANKNEVKTQVRLVMKID